MGYGRPDHRPTPTDGLCTQCGVHASAHRIRNTTGIRSRTAAYVAAWNKANPRPKASARIIGIDGEGAGRDPHNYFYLAAADEFGKRWQAGAKTRLSTVDCLDFILSLPRHTLIFGYAFLYDLTKILQDLPDKLLYLLFHEEKRSYIVTDPKTGKLSQRFKFIRWKNYRLNFMNRRFSLSSVESKRTMTIWDIFRFFQGKFTKALIDWEIASKERLTEMERMKDLRSVFDTQSRQAIEAYCDEECLYLAKLGRQLLETHEDCGLTLANYYGAGSTATALLKRMDVLRWRDPTPEAMTIPVASAFFGGRFENSVVGPVSGPVYNYDISSAYPYQAYLLPCLVCGRWEHSHSQKSIENARLALCSWTIGAIVPSAWGTLPIRSKDGTIAFPLSAAGGWTWKEEFLQAQRYNSAVQLREGWVYHTDCDHHPFRELSDIYRERVRIGKDARGIPLKLGPNSVYGKLAQSRGGLDPPFQSWIWAGNITSGTRAQLLEGQNVAKDKWNVLMYATDGIWSRERLTLPLPADTGTSDLSKPLGGWEEKRFDAGVFAVRPGIYFPLQPTDDQLKEVRARGLGKKVLYERWPVIVEAWKERAERVKVAGVERFIGAKSGISYGEKSGKYTRSPFYGEWVSYPIEVTFNPAPKRELILADGRLTPWRKLGESVPYKRAVLSPEALAMQLAETIAQEQPNADFSEEDDIGNS